MLSMSSSATTEKNQFTKLNFTPNTLIYPSRIKKTEVHCKSLSSNKNTILTSHIYCDYDQKQLYNDKKKDFKLHSK